MNQRALRSSLKLQRYLVVVAFGAVAIFLMERCYAVDVDLESYDPACGVSVRADGQALFMQWRTPEGATELTLNLEEDGPLVRSIAVDDGTPEPVIVLRDANPITVLSIAERDLKKRDGWTIFFDRVSNKPSKSEQLVLTLRSATVRSVGQRCVVDLDHLEGRSFSGKLRFTIYSGCDLIHVQAVVQTQQNARALLYHAGLTCSPRGKSISWIGLDDQQHRTVAKSRPAANQKVRHRTIAMETETGTVAVFPPPHRYFYPLDEAYNLGFTWWGTDFMNQVSSFGLGIRQDLQGDRRWVPWFNAPPGSEQRLDVFWLPSSERGAELMERVKAYTHSDRFPEIDGHKTFTSHYHIEHATRYLDQVAAKQSPGVPTALEEPEFVDVFKDSGIQIVHLAEFHNRLGRLRRDPAQTFPLLKLLHDECARLSEDEFLLLPVKSPTSISGVTGSVSSRAP